MKRYVYYLLSLIVTVMISTTVNAEVGDVITSLNQLNKSKCYTISTRRGKLVLNRDKTGILSSHKSGGETVNISASLDEKDAKWAVLPVDGGYCLYSLGNGQYLTSANSFCGSPNCKYQ